MLACACWKRTSIKHLQGIFIYNVTKDRKGKDSFLSSSLTDSFGSANDKVLIKMEIHLTSKYILLQGTYRRQLEVQWHR
jgi:hypothetical protein